MTMLAMGVEANKDDLWFLMAVESGFCFVYNCGTKCDDCGLFWTSDGCVVRAAAALTVVCEW